MIDARAAVVLEPGAVPQLADVQIRPPVTDEVLVRIAAVGICHTDVSVSAQLAQMWRRGDLPLEELVTTFSFDDFGDAWHSATTGGAVKPVLVMPF